MSSERGFRADLAASALAVAGTVLLAFLLFGAVEESYVKTEEARRLLHLVRGVSTSLLAALVAGTLSFRQHRGRLRLLSEEAARRRADAHEARSLLRLVVDSTPASLIVLDTDFRIVQANRLAEQVHGGALTGLVCHQALASCPHRCQECPASESLATGLPSAAPRPHTDPRTGEVFAVETRPFTLPDGRRHVLLVERIVTEQRKLQARLVHQEKMAAFGMLAAGIAHDLGNPLASIGAQLQLLDPDSLPPDSAGVIATVRQEVGRLDRILRELVDFARRRRDEATLVSVQGVVEDALRLLRHDHRMRAVSVARDYDPETPPVMIVEDHLMQVVLNLLLNALDAMPAGGELRVELGAAGHAVALRVHDSGTGMERSVLSRCFEPLFTTKEPGRGTGLGLSVSRDILEEAGGAIELHSAPAHGTTAVVTLPAAVLEGRAA